MSTCPGPFAVCDVRAIPLGRGMHALPFELLTTALEFLPQTDLLRAASVSRILRSSARRAGLYIHRKITWDLLASPFDALLELIKIVAHAAKYDCRLGVEFTCEIYMDDVDDRELPDGMRSMFEIAASIISSAMPHLAFLRVTLPDCFRADFETTLRSPAPHLHTFELLDCGIQGLLRSKPFRPVPSDLFNGHAPMLRSVALSYISLPSEPIPVFGCVRRLHLAYEDTFPSVDVARHFPLLRELKIEYLREGTAPPLEFDLRGMALHRLSIDSNDDEKLLALASPMVDLAAIPVLERQRDVDRNGVSLEESHADIGPMWAGTVSAADRLDLCGRICESAILDEDVSITFAPRCAAELGIRRIFRFRGWELEGPFYPLLDTAPGLTYLRLDNKYIAGLLLGGLELPALREMRIDLLAGMRRAEMLWPPSWGVSLADSDSDSDSESDDESQDGTDADAQGHRVSCPVLDALTIHAVDTPLRVRPWEAALLGRALGHQARARLVLCGVAFYASGSGSPPPTQHSAVEHEFRSVQFTPFTGGYSLKQRDDDIWSF